MLTKSSYIIVILEHLFYSCLILGIDSTFLYIRPFRNLIRPFLEQLTPVNLLNIYHARFLTSKNFYNTSTVLLVFCICVTL
jgi:hypothetical protein